MVISMKKYKIHYLNTEVAVTGLVNVSYYKLPKNYRDTTECHDFWELVTVESGQVEVVEDDRYYVLDGGTNNSGNQFSFYKEKNTLFMVIAISLAILFQPLAKITLSRDMWNIIDVIDNERVNKMKNTY